MPKKTDKQLTEELRKELQSIGRKAFMEKYGLTEEEMKKKE